MEAEVARLSLDGQNVRFERATLVEFLGWRLVLVGAGLKDNGVVADRRVALTVGGDQFVGTVRTSISADPAAPKAAGRQTTLRGVGRLARPGHATP